METLPRGCAPQQRQRKQGQTGSGFGPKNAFPVRVAADALQAHGSSRAQRCNRRFLRSLLSRQRIPKLTRRGQFGQKRLFLTPGAARSFWARPKRMGGAFPHRSGANIQGSREKPAKRKVNCRAAAREAPLEGFKWESGIRRSAASGRNSEPDSRQGPGWQTQSVWEPEWPNGEQSKGAQRIFGASRKQAKRTLQKFRAPARNQRSVSSGKGEE